MYNLSNLKEVIIICDPMSSRASVQLELVRSLVLVLRDEFEIKVVSPYLSNAAVEKLRSMKVSNAVSLAYERKATKLLFDRYMNNEASLWSISWIFEALFRANSGAYFKSMPDGNRTTINLSYTLPARCDLYWNQATPPAITLKSMGKYNPISAILYNLMNRLISLLDRRVRFSHARNSRTFVSASKYISDLYEQMGVKSAGILYDPKVFSNELLVDHNRSKDYVLAYIGKEVELDTVLSLANSGIKVIAFGAKVPSGTNVKGISEVVDYRGYVSDNELAELYSNALFTAFPFTEEPFGWVPIESMHYGTPVLTYNKQGPSETVLHNKTGWLVNTQKEFLNKARILWESRNSGITEADCTERSKEFSLQVFNSRLNELLRG